MRKILLLPFLLFLVACGSATAPAATTVPEPVDVDGGVEAGESAPANELPSADRSAVVTGTTPEEAGLIREQDYTQGAANPVVTIIEYGDFQ